MNQADTKNIIGRMLMDNEWAKLGDRKIAEHVGVSSTTVLRLRQAMEGAGQLIKQTTKTVVRNGKEFEVDVSVNQQKEEPTIASAVTNESHPQDLQEIKELSDMVNDLSEENQKLKDTIAIGAWDATDIEKEDIQETVKELRERIAILERENNSLRSSRDMYMNQAAELSRVNKALQARLKK
jgi:predicted transcriptional regulator